MLRRDHFIAKLINLLIRELNNCSLGEIFESHTMQKYVNLIAFLWKLISTEHIVVIMHGIPRLGSSCKKYTTHYDSLETLQLHCMPVLRIIVYCKNPIATLHNVSAVHWGEITEYTRSAQYTGGYFVYTWGCSVH